MRTDHPGIGCCYRHGGTTTAHRINAAKVKARVQVEEAHRAVVTMGLSRKIGPHEALLEEIGRTAGHVTWLEGKVQELQPDQLVWGTIKQTVENLPVVAPTGPTEGESSGVTTTALLPRTNKVEEAAVASMWLRLYQQERAHLTEVCKVAIQCGIAERQVRIAEEQGKMLVAVISAVLRDLGVNQEDKQVRASVHRQLVLVGTAQVS